MTQLSQEWLSLPSVDVGADLVALARLIIRGHLAPLGGFMTRTELAAIARRGRLPDGTPWMAPVRLPLPSSAVQQPPPRLLLRDLEGAPVALLTIEDAWSDAEGSWAGGRLAPVTAESSHLDSAPSWDTAGDAPRVVLPVTVAPSTAALRVAADAADAGGHVCVMVCEAPADRGAVPVGVVLAAVRAARDALPASSLARLRVPLPIEEPARQLLVAVLARSLGANALVVAGSPEQAPALPDGTSLTEAVAGLGLSALPTAEAAVPDGALLEQLRRDEPSLSGRFDPAVATAVRDSLRAHGRRGVTIFFTGLSGSGKSTIAARLAARLRDGGRPVTLLDGDLVRRHLSSELGFSRAHRALNIERIAFVAGEIGRHGGLTICAPIAPYDETRKSARAIVEAAGGAFVLVFVDTPLAVCEARDRKGLYARARAGLIQEFTGISDPYEPPQDAEITIRTTSTSPDDAADVILAWVEQHLPGAVAGAARG